MEDKVLPLGKVIENFNLHKAYRSGELERSALSPRELTKTIDSANFYLTNIIWQYEGHVRGKK